MIWQLLSQGDDAASRRLRDKGPAAIIRLSRLLAAALIARAADRLDNATVQEVGACGSFGLGVALGTNFH